MITPADIISQLPLPETRTRLWLLLAVCGLALLLFLALALILLLAHRRRHTTPTTNPPLTSPQLPVVSPESDSPQSSVLSPQPSALSPQSDNPQSAIRNPQSPIPFWLPTAIATLILLCCLATGFIGTFALNRSSQNATATAVAVAAITATAEALANITPTPTMIPPTPTPVPHPANCAMIRAQEPGAADGDYTIFLEGDAEQPATIYCHNMDGLPVEYLSLANTGGNFNYSMISYPEGALVTQYEKVRLSPATLVVDPSDRTFTSFPGSVPGYTSLGENAGGAYAVLNTDYARAESCNRGVPTAPPGQANLDLTGTDFALAETVAFAYQGGEVQNPTFTISEDRKTATLAISGRCAHIQPAGPLRLIYAPAPE